MAKQKFPDVIYVNHETDANDKSAHWLTAQESIPSDGPQWKAFGVYKLVGSGRARDTTESKIKMQGKFKVPK